MWSWLVWSSCVRVLIQSMTVARSVWTARPCWPVLLWHQEPLLWMDGILLPTCSTRKNNNTDKFYSKLAVTLILPCIWLDKGQNLAQVAALPGQYCLSLLLQSQIHTYMYTSCVRNKNQWYKTTKMSRMHSLSCASPFYFSEQLLFDSFQQVGSKVPRVQKDFVLKGNLWWWCALNRKPRFNWMYPTILVPQSNYIHASELDPNTYVKEHISRAQNSRNSSLRYLWCYSIGKKEAGPFLWRNYKQMAG